MGYRVESWCKFGKNTVLFSGSIPGEIGKLTKLRYLNFARCGFEGKIPAEIGNFGALTRLNLSENRFTGSVPALWTRYPTLAREKLLLQQQGFGFSNLQ